MAIQKNQFQNNQYQWYTTLSAIVIFAGFVLLYINSPGASTQSGEVEAIKATIRSATEAFYACDADRWQSARTQDENAVRTIVYNGYYRSTVGWENFGPEMIRYLNHCEGLDSLEFVNDNYIIHQEGKLAWVAYDQTLTMPGVDSTFTRISREHRVMVKENGQWKIAAQITHNPQSFGSSPEAIELSLNTTGYLLLKENKVKEAIEVFKLNVQFFPKSWNVYDSLGEAYAEAGDTEEAIKNYRKSIELNPGNESGKQALARLQQALNSHN